MKDLLKNKFPLDGKRGLWFVPARKSVSTASSRKKFENGFH